METVYFRIKKKANSITSHSIPVLQTDFYLSVRPVVWYHPECWKSSRQKPAKGAQMKKFLIIVLIAVMAISSALAGDFSFLFTELDQHVEILGGFLPTLVTIGGSYNGLDLIPGDLTQIQATIGGGYTQRKVFQDPTDGSPLLGDFFTFDTWQARWNLKFLQGFGESWVPEKDLVTFYAGYEGRWEKYVDSMVKGELRSSGITSINFEQQTFPVPTFDNWKGGLLTSSPVFTDLAKDRSIIATIFYAGLRLNGMADTGVTCDGILGDINFKWAPNSLSTDRISYYSATFNLVGSKTLYQKQFSNGSNAFSIVLIDRANVNWTDGAHVPVYAQGPVSLGRKVRGYNTYSFNTQFSVVNNLDIRLSGPDRIFDFMKGVFPRLNLFIDCGYHMGKYFNSDIEGSHFLASTGAQLEVSFMDFIDLGIQVAYLLTPTKNVVLGATFFLDF